MGRWSHLDTDEDRLPDGMTRVGYDADTQTYTYRDADGSLWRGAPGVQYGKLFRVKEATPLASVTVPEAAEGDEPEQVLNEGVWEPPGDEGPSRGNSFVKKVIKRLNSVKRSRAGTPASAHDSVAESSHAGGFDDDKHEVSVTAKSASPDRSFFGDEKQQLSEQRRSSDDASLAKGVAD